MVRQLSSQLVYWSWKSSDYCRLHERYPWKSFRWHDFLQLRHNSTNFRCSGKPQPRNDTSCSLFLGGTLNYCAVCPLCTWVAQLGSVPVLWGDHAVVPWSPPHLLPDAPLQVTRQDELHQLAPHGENLSNGLGQWRLEPQAFHRFMTTIIWFSS